MKYRKLRIAWSVAWGVVCLLVVALWVRSYWWLNSWLRTAPKIGLYIQLFEGEVKVMRIPSRFPNSQVNTWYPGTFSEMAIRSTKTWEPTGQHWAFIGPIGRNRSIVKSYPTRFTIVPIWATLLVAATLAAVPWIRWRFSLRTLLIAMTAAAIGLGWIVYAMRR